MTKASGIVLYVEDEEDDRFLMLVAFEREGLKAVVRTVSDGRLAMDYLSATGAYTDRQAHPAPGVVLLDLNLPEIHGFDVLEWIRAHPRHSALPVVVFTSSEREEDRARAKLLGADDFVLKPNSPNGFKEVARRLNDRYLSGGSTVGGPVVAAGAPRVAR
jgi:CheY-like chemotaxis protein